MARPRHTPTGPRRAPSLVAADARGRILDVPAYALAAVDGRGTFRPDPAGLVPLPPGADLYLLPGRRPVGFPWGVAAAGPATLPEGAAVAAFLPPAWVRHALPAFARTPGAPLLPLYAYCAVGFADGRFWVPAERVDPDVRQDPGRFDLAAVEAAATRILAAATSSRLLRHVAECATVRACPAARNYLLGRFEAPLPASPGCNSACVGCISEQPGGRTRTFGRIGFVPTPEEVADLAAPHLETAPRAVVSFGQGCEGEPLLVAETIAAAIRLIRARTGRGTINLNTNGSRPEAVVALAEAGLEAIRVSLNSARPGPYAAYYQPRGYAFGDVVETLRAARRHGLYVSVNWLVFPGVSDREAEVVALEDLARAVPLDLIQVRNLNLDPDLYLEALGPGFAAAAGEPLGMAAMLSRLRRTLPGVALGYFNPPRSARE